MAGQSVVLVATPGQLHAMGATCSHYGASLDQGSVERDCLVCPWHGSRFRLSDGSVARGPATAAPQLSYDVRIQDDRASSESGPETTICTDSRFNGGDKTLVIED